MVERAQIEVLFGQGLSFPQIASRIGRDRTTVWREVCRNNSYRGARTGGAGTRHPDRSRAGRPGLGGAYRWVYSHTHAHRRALRRALRPRAMKLRPGWGRPYPPLWDVVVAKLRCRWSPQQISAWLKTEYPEQPENHVSHETIYQAIYYQARGGMRQELARQVALRTGRGQRRSQSREAKAGRGAKPWTVDFTISSRPPEADDRAVPGHWEGDLVIGKGGKSALITLVERTSRYTLLGHLPTEHTSMTVIATIQQMVKDLNAEQLKTITWDQGVEMAETARVRIKDGCEVYFCDPHSPWQRPTNENTNGEIRRRFYKKGTDFAEVTPEHVAWVQDELNDTPRQVLGGATPREILQQIFKRGALTA